MVAAVVVVGWMGAMLARDRVRSRARGKVPSAAMHREVSMHESRPEQQRGREQWIVVSGTNTIGHGLHVADRVQGLTGTLLHDVIWWVNSWISVELQLCCCRC